MMPMTHGNYAEADARHAYPPMPECVAKGWVRVVPTSQDETGNGGYIAVDARRETNPRWDQAGQLMEEAQAWRDAARRSMSSSACSRWKR
jgi:hypothetical protein